MNDAQIFEAILQGNEDAFELLFKTHYVNLVAFANSYIHDLDKSESLVQEVFVALWEGRKKYQIKSYKSYLFSAVKNRCTNELNRQKHALNYQAYLTTQNQVEYMNYSDSATLNFINKVIDSLPAQRRKIFKLNRIDGLRYKEIAKLLNISPKTVENQMGQALKFLRSNLGALKKQVYHILL